MFRWRLWSVVSTSMAVLTVLLLAACSDSESALSPTGPSKSSHWAFCYYSWSYNLPAASECRQFSLWEMTERQRVYHAIDDIWAPPNLDPFLHDLCGEIWYTAQMFEYFWQWEGQGQYGEAYTYFDQGTPHMDFATEIFDREDHYWQGDEEGTAVIIHEIVHAWQMWNLGHGDLTGDPKYEAQAQKLEKAPQYGGCNVHGGD